MSTVIARTIMGDQNCSLAILVCAQPDLAVDTGMRVLCVDYLLVKQKQQPQSPKVFSLGFLWVTKIFCYSLSLSLESTPNSLFSHPQCSLADVIIHIINYKVLSSNRFRSHSSKLQVPGSNPSQVIKTSPLFPIP